MPPLGAGEPELHETGVRGANALPEQEEVPPDPMAPWWWSSLDAAHTGVPIGEGSRGKHVDFSGFILLFQALIFKGKFVGLIVVLKCS